MNAIEFTAWIGTDGPSPEIEAFIRFILVGGALVACVAAYVVFYLVQRFVFKKSKFDWRILLVALLVGVLIFPGSYYIREAVDEKRWINLQNRCAREAGYEHPGDNNNPSVFTWESQQVYNKCIERGRS